MLRVVVVVVCLAVSVLAQKKCCFPDQFVMKKAINTGTDIEGVGNLAIIENGDIAFDFKNKRVAYHTLQTIMSDPQVVQEMLIIENSTEGLSWLAYPQQKKCSRVKSSAYAFHSPQCIPDEAKYQGKIVFGDNAMELDSWRVDSVVGLSGTYSITVDKDCIPNGETFVGKLTGAWGTNQQLISTTKFFNFTRGISDPDKYFKVPDYCKEETKEEDFGRFKDPLTKLY